VLQAVSGKVTLSALIDMLEDAAELGAEEGAIAQHLADRLDTAKAFDARAIAFVTGAEAAIETGDNHGKPTMEEVDELIAEGRSINIKLDSLTQAESMLNAARYSAHAPAPASLAMPCQLVLQIIVMSCHVTRILAILGTCCSTKRIPRGN
jgi:hypothetical protein